MLMLSRVGLQKVWEDDFGAGKGPSGTGGGEFLSSTTSTFALHFNQIKVFSDLKQAER